MILSRIKPKTESMVMKQKGMTLMELMIAVAIVGVLAAIALPSYQNSIRKSKRADATTTVSKVAAEQEKFYMQNNKYGTTAQIATKMNGTNVISTQSDHYTVAITSADVTKDYTITATAKGNQAKDTGCQTFTYNQSGTRGAKTDKGADNTKTCW